MFFFYFCYNFNFILKNNPWKHSTLKFHGGCLEIPDFVTCKSLCSWMNGTPSLLITCFSSRSAFDPIKKGLNYLKNQIFGFLSYLTPANIKKQIAIMKTKTFPELVKGFFFMFFYSIFYTGWLFYSSSK